MNTTFKYEEMFDEIPKIVVEPPGPKAKAVIEKNYKYVSRLAMGISKVMQIVYDKAYGAVVQDVDGNVYIDFTAAVTTNNPGHTHPKVSAAIIEQAKKFLQAYEYPTQVKADVAEILAQVVPIKSSEVRVVFANAGTEANENALRLAEHYTKRHEIIAFWESFHGKTRGSASVTTWNKKMRKDIKLVGNMISVPYPDCNHCFLKHKYPDCGLACFDFLDYMREYQSQDDIAAIIIEPVLGGGCAVPPKEWMKQLREWTQENNILFIDDEVQAGFGRTGKFFAIEHFDVEPDIITGGKGLAGGLPTGATIFRKEYEDAIVDTFGGFYTSTFGGNPIVMAAARATLKAYLDEKMPEHATEVGEHIKKRLIDEFKPKYSFLGNIQGKGLLIGIEFLTEDGKPDNKMPIKVVREAFKRGLLIFTTGHKGNFLKVCPPLVITKELADKGLDILDEAIDAARKSM